MDYRRALVQVRAIRQEVVAIVGICGRGTHPLTELIEELEKCEPTLTPEAAVREATKIRNSLADFR